MSRAMAVPEVARYCTETTPLAIRGRSARGGPDLSLADREALAWQDWASCAETDPEAWFPERGESPEPARRICEGCPVRAECLEYAVEEGIRYGVWGGLTERQRRPLLAARWPGTERCPAGRHPLAGDNLLPGGKCRACSEAGRKAAGTRKILKGLAA